MVTGQKIVSVAEFDAFINRPENHDRLFELIRGEIVEVPSNPYTSAIAAEIIFLLKLYLREQQLEGFVTGESGGFMVAGERYAPDVAYIKASTLAKTGYHPDPPQLAVEVVSPTDQDRHLRVKIANDVAVGTVVWVVYPKTQEVEIYVPNQPVQVVGKDDVVAGEPVLSGLRIAVKDIFPQSA